MRLFRKVRSISLNAVATEEGGALAAQDHAPPRAYISHALKGIDGQGIEPVLEDVVHTA